jgi:hypothetical protein
MATLRDGAATLELAHRLRVNSHWCPVVKSLNPHEIALVGHGCERQRSHQALPNAQLRSPRSDSRGDEGPVRELADGLPVHGHGHLRGCWRAIHAENEYQGAPGRRTCAMEITLGEYGKGGEQAANGGEHECRAS